MEQARLILGAKIIEIFGVDSPIVSISNKMMSLNDFEWFGIAWVLLFAFLSILSAFLSFLWRKFKKRKNKNAYVLSINSKTPMPDSLNIKKAGPKAIFNFARLFKNMLTMAKIEEDIAKEKPVRLNLSQAIFMIQNFNNYNYFANEEGKVLFEKVKRDIVLDERAQNFGIPNNTNKTSDVFTEERLKEITSKNVALEFNEDGNIISCIDKEAEKKSMANNILKDVDKEIQKQAVEKPQENTTEKEVKKNYESWCKITDKNELDLETDKIKENTNTNEVHQQDDKKDETYSAPMMSAKDLKRQSISKRKQKQKEEEKIQIVEIGEAGSKLSNLNVEDFVFDALVDDGKDILESPQHKKENKKKKEANTQKNNNATTESSTQDVNERIVTFIRCQCTEDEIKNKTIFFDKYTTSVFFRKKFFSKLGKPVLVEREGQYWKTLKDRFGIDFNIDVPHKDYPQEHFISIKIEDTESLKKVLRIIEC